MAGSDIHLNKKRTALSSPLLSFAQSLTFIHRPFHNLYLFPPLLDQASHTSGQEHITVEQIKDSRADQQRHAQSSVMDAERGILVMQSQHGFAFRLPHFQDFDRIIFTAEVDQVHGANLHSR